MMDPEKVNVKWNECTFDFSVLNAPKLSLSLEKFSLNDRFIHQITFSIFGNIQN